MAVCDPGRTLASPFQRFFASHELNHNYIICVSMRDMDSSVEDDVKRNFVWMYKNCVEFKHAAAALRRLSVLQLQPDIAPGLYW